MGWDFKFASRKDGSIQKVIFTDEFFSQLGNGKVINAIKELRNAQGVYYDSEGQPLSVMGLKEAKEAVDNIMALLWPPKVVTCPTCFGKGTVEEKHVNHPLYRS